MTRLFDKLAVLLLIMYGLIGRNDSAAAVTVLTAFIVSMASGTKYAQILRAVFLLSCLAEPSLCLGSPALLYDCANEKNFPRITAAAAAAIFFKLSGQELICCIVSCTIAVLLKLKTLKLESTQKALTSSYDSMKELNLALRETNMRLEKMRDSEVYTAALQERSRIARDIHDGVGHLLTRSLLQTGALIMMTADEEQKRRLEEIKGSLDLALNGIRSSVHDLHDDSIDLKKTLSELLASVSGRFACSLEYDCSPNMPKEIKLSFVGIVREAVSNAAKHSSGDSLTVAVTEYPGFYRLVIFDNGKNQQVGEMKSSDHVNGIGLENMRERVRAADGNISVLRMKDGFKIVISVPKKEIKHENSNNR